MPVTIVVGGQYGSEGKGKVVALLARSKPTACVVRCGGPNSGHTTSVNGREVVLRQLPASIGVTKSLLAISAGAVIDEDVLEKEVTEFEIERCNLVIDPRAAVLSEDDKRREESIAESLGSTGSGNGQALARRMMRTEASLANSSARLSRIARIEPVAPILHELIAIQKHVIIEGTQGFGLSLLHGPHYPHVTSKDTTASAFAMEAGISPRDVDHVVMVIRTYPIRVGGSSGPLKGETTWDQIQIESGADDVELEFTSVTKKLRRVANFDIGLVRSAVSFNRPTSLALMGLDRLDACNRGITDVTELSESATDFLHMLHREIDVPIHWVGTGPRTFDALPYKAAFSVERADVR